MLERGVPAIVVRCLIFIYVEQVAWITWGNTKSSVFHITNGTRQGAVLSPIFWCLYCDNMLKELRKLGVGCHLGGRWVGATMYADDLILLAPTRSAMAAMLKVCEDYAREHNISFSTDPNPAKSKTKCLYMCGKTNVMNYPANLKLNGRDLPFVKTWVMNSAKSATWFRIPRLREQDSLIGVSASERHLTLPNPNKYYTPS